MSSRNLHIHYTNGDGGKECPSARIHELELFTVDHWKTAASVSLHIVANIEHH